MNATVQFKIAQLRQDKVVYMVEAIAVFIFVLFINAFLPQILLKYVYANQQLTQEPVLFEYLQNASFILGVGYFLFAILGNLMRAMKIAKLEKEMMSMEMNDCCGDNCNCGDGGACCTNCSGNCDCSNHENCDCGSCEMASETSNDGAMEMMKKAGGTKKTVSKKK